MCKILNILITLFQLLTISKSQQCNLFPIQIAPPLKYEGFKLKIDLNNLKDVQIQKNNQSSISFVTPTQNIIVYEGQQYQVQSYNLYGQSLHTVMGKYYDLELQITCKSDSGQVIILCVLMQANGRGSSIFLNSINQRDLQRLNEKQTVQDKELDMQYIFESEYFIRYQGTDVKNQCQPVQYLISINFLNIDQKYQNFLNGSQNYFQPVQRPQNMILFQNRKPDKEEPEEEKKEEEKPEEKEEEEKPEPQIEPIDDNQQDPKKDDLDNPDDTDKDKDDNSDVSPAVQKILDKYKDNPNVQITFKDGDKNKPVIRYVVNQKTEIENNQPKVQYTLQTSNTNAQKPVQAVQVQEQPQPIKVIPSQNIPIQVPQTVPVQVQPIQIPQTVPTQIQPIYVTGTPSGQNYQIPYQPLQIIVSPQSIYPSTQNYNSNHNDGNNTGPNYQNVNNNYNGSHSKSSSSSSSSSKQSSENESEKNKKKSKEPNLETKSEEEENKLDISDELDQLEDKEDENQEPVEEEKKSQFQQDLQDLKKQQQEKQEEVEKEQEEQKIKDKYKDRKKNCKRICIQYALGSIVNRHYEKKNEWEDKGNFLQDYQRDYECLKFKCIDLQQNKPDVQQNNDICDVQLNVVLNQNQQNTQFHDEMKRRCKNVYQNKYDKNQIINKY